jgi:hypothetical protein
MDKLREIAKQELLSWSKRIPDQDRPVIGTGGDQVLTANDIRRHVANETPQGRRVIEQYAQMAYQTAMQTLLGSTKRAQEGSDAAPGTSG